LQWRPVSRAAKPTKELRCVLDTGVRAENLIESVCISPSYVLRTADTGDRIGTCAWNGLVSNISWKPHSNIEKNDRSDLKIELACF
jgi:hypothetical protein